MLNIHVNYKEETLFPEIKPSYEIHSFFEGNLYCSEGKKAICFNKENSIKEVEVAQNISNIQYSDFHGTPIVFAKDGIYQVQEEATKIFDIENDSEGSIGYGKIYDGGAKAILVRENGVYLFDFEKNQSHKIDEISGSINAISVRSDNKFIAISTDNMLFTVSTENSEIHGKSETPKLTSLSWSPRLTWLAGISGNKIYFYEKNTELRTSVETEKELYKIAYSNDSDVLATVDVEGGISIFTTKNRKWYKKITIPTSENTVIFWNSTINFELIAANSAGFCMYCFNHTTDSDGNNMFVIDGKVLNISHWDRSLIPPPLAHEKLTFDSQINYVACDEDHLAVFTETKCVIPATNTTFDIPPFVHCATFRGDELFFANDSSIYKFNGSVEEVENKNGYVSFITPNFTVFNGRTIVPVSGDKAKTIESDERIIAFTDNEGVAFYLVDSGILYSNGDLVSKEVYSFLAIDKLLTYVYKTNNLVIKFGDEKTERTVENNAVVLFYVKKLFSIIIQMQRGNIETQAPHVIVEYHMKELLKEKKYEDALFISKRYQIPFSRIINLGEISIPDLLKQIPDSKLRPFISVLTPIYKEEKAKDEKAEKAEKTPEEILALEKEKEAEIAKCNKNKDFILALLSFIFDTKIVAVNGKYEYPEEVGPNQIGREFFSVADICFVLLDNPVAAIKFSCSVNDAKVCQASLEFLLTLFDADRLFDLSMKTYDLRCIRTVGHVTMREPSSYVPMLEEFSKMDKNIMMAEIDETLGDYGEAIIHYAACGPEYYTKCMELAIREEFYDEAIRAIPQDTEQFKKVYLAKIEALNKAKKYSDLARMVAASKDEPTILKYLDKVIIGGLFDLVVGYISPENYENVLKTLISTGRIARAADFTFKELSSPKRAAELYIKCHKWANAITCGRSVEEITEMAFNYHYTKAVKDKEEAERLRENFNTIKEKQKGHADSNRRTGKKKEKRGLPAIVESFKKLLPSEEENEKEAQAEALLIQCNRLDDLEKLRVAYNLAVRAIIPIPILPENEQAVPPQHLKQHMGYPQSA